MTTYELGYIYIDGTPYAVKDFTARQELNTQAGQITTLGGRVKELESLTGNAFNDVGKLTANIHWTNQDMTDSTVLRLIGTTTTGEDEANKLTWLELKANNK